MANFYIPNDNVQLNGQGVIRQLGFNDTAGELWSTYNIDLHTNPGKIKLARPLKLAATDNDLGGDSIEAFAILGNDAYALTDSNLYTSSTPFTTWTLEDSGPQSADDMVVFKGQLVITDGSSGNIDAYDGSTFTSNWWTARSNPSIDSGIGHFPHIMEVLRIGREKLAVTDGNYVHSYRGGITADPDVKATVDIGMSFVATCIKTTIRSAFIGSYTEDAEQAYVFEWDGESDVYTQAYPVGAKAVLSMEIVDDVPIIITERGEIKKFNNAGFTTVAQFPFATKPLFANGVETGLIQKNNLARPIHPKGMKRAGDIIYIFVNFTSAAALPIGSIDERTYNGVWAFNLSTNSLTHLCSPDNEQVFTSSSPLMVINENKGRLFVGGKKENDDTGIWIEDLDDDTEHYGHLTTVEIQSDTVSSAFNGTYIKAYLGDDDSIVSKYRTSRDVLYPVNLLNAVWTGVNENQFTSTSTDLVHVKTRFDAGQRDEIEVMYGQGAGRLAHITNITLNTGTYTITIDEALGVNGELATIRIDNWKKIPKEYTSDNADKLLLGTDGVTATWIQFRYELKGKAGRPEIRQLIVNSNAKETLK